MLKKFSLQEGNEIRGLRIRLYPDADTKEKLKILAEDCRRAWNWLVSQTETVLEARRALAVREGLVGPRPQRPEYEGLSPEDARRTREKYIQVCIAWHQAVHKATKDRPECSFRKLKEQQEHFRCKYDYQLMRRVIGWRYQDDSEPRSIEPGAHLLQSLVKNYFTKGGRRKKFRKSSDTMPLQVRSGQCLELGDFGSRGKNHHNNGVQADICNTVTRQARGQGAAERNYYNCRITINGLRILGRLPGRAPWGRVLEGVSLIEEADGWWCSIKQEVPVRVPPTAVPGSVIGIDVGLDNIVAMSDGKRVENPRGKAYAERIAGRQAEKKPVGRLHLAMARHTKHLIYNEIIKPLAEIETIKIEKLVGDIGQRGSVKTSAMRQVAFLLKERYGDRVQEVEPHYTSQDCSRCGHRSKESWSYEHGRYGECPKCGYREDRDVNAARNVAARSAISLRVANNGVQADICNGGC